MVSARTWREFASVTFAVCVLATGSAVTVAVASAVFHDYRTVAPTTARRIAPPLRGSVVSVRLLDMSSMMGGTSMMRMLVAPSAVPHGTVSFRVANTGVHKHELVVLPLAGTRPVGTRPPGDDGAVDEVGSLGAASATCAAGRGTGIAPGSLGWVTLHLAPGRYELLCNLPGHYEAGMYAELDVG